MERRVDYLRDIPSCSNASPPLLLKDPLKGIDANDDCWRMILDFLGMRDIVTLSNACGRMCQVSGEYFRADMPAVQCNWIGMRGPFIGEPSHWVHNLIGYFKKVVFHDELRDPLKPDSYVSLRTLILHGIYFNDEQIINIRDVLENIEAIHIRKNNINNVNIHDKIMKYCPNLSRLTFFKNYDEFNAIPSNMFQQDYPLLQCFEYIHHPTSNELHSFLERNPNIRKFSIDMIQLWANKDLFMDSHIRLDCLDVHTSHSDTQAFNWTSIVELLQSLHDQRFYKSLHMTLIYSTNFEQLVEQMANLNTLERLVIPDDVGFNKLVHLKELYLASHLTEAESLAKSLVNLEILFIKRALSTDILPFFEHSKKLKIFQVNQIFGYDSFIFDDIINLPDLNEKREKLGARKKLTLCVDEQNYLATINKFSSPFEMVEIAREESISSESYEKFSYHT